MDQKMQFAIIIILIVIMYIQPPILGKFANCCLGKALLLVVVIYLALHKTMLGLLAALVFISSIYNVNREGFTDEITEKAAEAANAALDVIGVNSDDISNDTSNDNNTIKNGNTINKYFDYKIVLGAGSLSTSKLLMQLMKNSQQIKRKLFLLKEYY